MRSSTVNTGFVLSFFGGGLVPGYSASKGSFVHEPPGEIHTLVVDEAAGGAPEMITFFNIAGAMIYLDEAGQTTGFDDVFTKIDLCRRHDAAVGLGSDCVDQFVR
ncbi:MAG: hypothetical protein ABIR94_11420 [Rubrivivax sp.]